MQGQLKPMGIKLAPEDRERLRRLGEKKKRSAHWIAKEAISEYLDREEAAESFKDETVARWEEYRQNAKAIADDEVVKWLDSWGTDHELKSPE